MKKLSFVGTVIFVSLFSMGAFAQDVAVTTAPDDGGGFSPMVIGGYMGMGMAGCMGDGCGDDAKMRFAGSGGFYFDYYLNPTLALDVGLGMIGRGLMVKDGDNKSKLKVNYLEIPVGIKMNFSGFQLGVGVAMFLGMSGKVTWDGDSSGEADLEDEYWDYNKRFNLGAKIFAGYAIPIGPIAIVPGLEWSMDLLNNASGDLADVDEATYRFMNIMFRVGVDFGL